MVGVGLVLAVLAAQISLAVGYHQGWLTIVGKLIGLVVFSVGAWVLTRRGMRGTDRSRSFQFGLGIGCILGAFEHWVLVPAFVMYFLP
jgi:ABC-type enterobactin transport system permease subunit